MKISDLRTLLVENTGLEIKKITNMGGNSVTDTKDLFQFQPSLGYSGRVLTQGNEEYVWDISRVESGEWELQLIKV